MVLLMYTMALCHENILFNDIFFYGNLISLYILFLDITHSVVSQLFVTLLMSA